MERRCRCGDHLAVAGAQICEDRAVTETVGRPQTTVMEGAISAPAVRAAAAVRGPERGALGALAGGDLTEQERAWLERLDEDGLILTGLMVKKLRFERLTRGDRTLADLFERDAKRFMELYRAYNAAVPPTACLPGHEAELYRQWQVQGAPRADKPPADSP